MATFNKFDVFTQDLVSGNHQFGAHTFKVVLTNSAPVATNTVIANITDLSTANGYTAGGGTTTVSLANATGVEKVTCTDVVTTATGAVGPFRYAVLYNFSQSSPVKPLIGWVDYGSSVTLANGETFTVDFDGTNGVFTVT